MKRLPRNKMQITATILATSWMVVLTIGWFSCGLAEAQAGSYIWTSSNASNWDKASSWSAEIGSPPLGANGPTESDTALVTSSGAIYLNGKDRSILNLTIGTAGTIAPTQADSKLRVINNLTINAGSSLVLRDGSSTFMDVEVNHALVDGIFHIGASTGTGGVRSFKAHGNVEVTGSVRVHRNSMDVDLGSVSFQSGGSLLLFDAVGAATGHHVKTISVRALAGMGTVQGSNLIGSSSSTSTNVTLKVDTFSVSDPVFSGVLENGSGTNASLNLLITGMGVQTFSGANTYTGSTTVEKGTLDIRGGGSINSTAGIELRSGATLRYSSHIGLSTAVSVTAGRFIYNSEDSYSGTLQFTSGTLGGTNLHGTLDNLTIGADQVVSPGDGLGIARTGSQIWAGRGGYLWEINDALGTAAGDTGWDLLTGTGVLTITATPLEKFTIHVTSLTLEGVRGEIAGFDDAQNYRWKIAAFEDEILLDVNVFDIDTTHFLNRFQGSFSLLLGNQADINGENNELYLIYTVPESSSIALASLGAFLGVFLFRRKFELVE